MAKSDSCLFARIALQVSKAVLPAVVQEVVSNCKLPFTWLPHNCVASVLRLMHGTGTGHFREAEGAVGRAPRIAPGAGAG